MAKLDAIDLVHVTGGGRRLIAAGIALVYGATFGVPLAGMLGLFDGKPEPTGQPEHGATDLPK